MQETHYHKHLIYILHLEINSTKHSNILDAEH